MMSKSDEIFSKPLEEVKDFAFDDSVANVFDDMIDRSVPGYRDIVAMIGILSKRYYQAGTLCYDLGCSLGAVSFSIVEQFQNEECKVVAVDKSESMTSRLKERIKQKNKSAQINVVSEDIRNIDFDPTSFVALNFTLQFLPIEDRKDFLKRVYDALLPGGALIVSEKILLEPDEVNDFQIDLYHTFKKYNGYSDLEISQKRTALEKVLLPESLKLHDERLKSIGFKDVYHWFQCFNFASMVAVK